MRGEKSEPAPFDSLNLVYPAHRLPQRNQQYISLLDCSQAFCFLLYYFSILLSLPLAKVYNEEAQLLLSRVGPPKRLSP